MSNSENEENEKPYPKDSQVQGEYEEQNNNQNEENDNNNGEENNFPEEENNENGQKQSNNNSDIENNDINNNNVNDGQEKQNEENFNDNTFPEKEEDNNDDFAEPENQENNNNKEEKLDENEENNNNKTNSFRFSNEHDARLSGNGPLNIKNVKDNEFEYEEENKNENNENINNNNVNNNNSFGFRDSDLNNTDNNDNENNNQYENDFNNNNNENENENNFNKLRNSEKSDGYMNNNNNNNNFNADISNPYNNNNSQIKKSNNNNFNYAKNPYVSDNDNNNNNFNNKKNNNFNNKNNNFNNNNNFNKKNTDNNNNQNNNGYGNNNQTYNNNMTQGAFIPQDAPITNKLNSNNYNYSSNYPSPNYSSHNSDYDALFERYEQYPEDSDGFNIDPSKRGKDSSTTAGIQIANTIMGAGILSIPLMMSYLGILLGTILLLFLAVLTIYSVYILMRCHQITGKSGYSMFGKITMGTVGSVIVKIIIIVNNMGLCICYLRIFGEVFQTIIQSFVSKGSFWATNWHNFVFILFGSVVLFFFIFIKNISSLKKVSYLGVIAVLIFVILLTILLLYKTIASELDSDISWRFLFPDCTFPEAFHAAPTVFLAFLFQFNVFPIYYSLQNRGSRSMFRATKIGVFCSLIIFLIVGIVGFLLYGFYYNYDDENYQEVYGEANTDDATYDTILDKLNDDMILYKGYNLFVVIIIIIICVSFMITCITSFPILFLSLRVNYINALEVCKRAKDNHDTQSVQIFQGKHETKKYTVIDKKMLILVTLVLYLFMIAIAILIYNLRTMFQIIGAIAGTFIAFILPNIFYIRIVRMSGKNYSLIAPFIILILGIVFFVMSLVMAFFN